MTNYISPEIAAGEMQTMYVSGA